MADFNGFLMRDSLKDTGVIPSPGYPYYSPDVIAHAQVASPQSFFTANYSSDPNEAVQLGSRLNPIYVRAKNLSSGPLTGFVSVFRASPSLFLTPSVWKNNPLKTASGQTYVPLPPLAPPNSVAVGTEPLYLDATASNLFCVVGIVSTTSQPTIPNDFKTYSEYIEWVTKNQNVCGRNLNIVRNFPNRSFERLEGFSNPSEDAVPTLFKVEVKGGTLPAGTTFGLQCAPLNLNTSWNISQGPTQTASGMTPAKFNGTVTTWATLSGGGWPNGVSIETAVYVGVTADDPVASLATPFEELAVAAEEVEGLPANGKLVRLGNVETLFVTG
jgi:hypothetical protein